MATYTITWERKSMHHWPHCYPCNIYVLRDNLPESLIHPPCRAPPPNPFLPLPSTLKFHHTLQQSITCTYYL